MNLTWIHLFLLVSLPIFAWARYRYPDKEYAFVKVQEEDFFEDVECSDLDSGTFQRGLYYVGTACEDVNLLKLCTFFSSILKMLK